MITRIGIDAHTHTVFSGHAFSTLEENASWVRKSKVVDGFCSTDHSPHTRHSGMDLFVGTVFPLLPRDFEGVRIHYGMEIDLKDNEGNVTLEEDYLYLNDFTIVSLHKTNLVPGNYTEGVCKCLENPFIDLLGHPCSPLYPFDYEKIINTAKKHNKLIELNENYVKDVPFGVETYKKILELCRKNDVRICINSDAHFSRLIGVVDHALALVNEIEFPEELIVNRTVESFEEYLKEREQRWPQGRLPHPLKPENCMSIIDW